MYLSVSACTVCTVSILCTLLSEVYSILYDPDKWTHTIPSISTEGVSVRPPDTSPDTSQPSKPAAADPKPNVEKNQKKWFGVLRVDGVIVDTHRSTEYVRSVNSIMRRLLLRAVFDIVCSSLFVYSVCLPSLSLSTQSIQSLLRPLRGLRRLRGRQK